MLEVFKICCYKNRMVIEEEVIEVNIGWILGYEFIFDNWLFCFYIYYSLN